MRKLQEVKEELHGSSDDDETSSFQAEATANFNNNRTTLINDFQRMYINEESVEEDDPVLSASERSLINEDKERRGEHLAS
jgi:hypothetical protein